jgi:hypothetical protein
MAHTPALRVSYAGPTTCLRGDQRFRSCGVSAHRLHGFERLILQNGPTVSRWGAESRVT